ncbi:rod shape-determining protein [Halomicroarcula sp. GCM10025709]|uniref:rod shape-determining protein n=1 Tax=Haloarcula TaxID=2237 RepID=UPI0024C3389D|nr:rod shape-determining protein [Halomicroarcula sp. YJ-61-S]
MSEDDAEAGDDAEFESLADGGTVPVGVKLGSTRTVIALPDGDGGNRIVKTLTCMATYEDALTGEEKILYGEEAAREYPDRVQYMLRSGLPEDADRAEMTKTFFEAVIEENDIPEDSGVVYAIPTIDNPAGLDNLRSVIEDSSIGTELVESYPESLCGSIPAFGEALEAIDEIFVAVNMGSTNLEASAYRRGEQLAPFTTGAVTGNEVDRMIANYVEEETQGRVNIDTQTAREYKEEHADFVDFEPFTDIIQQPGGGSHEFTIERSVMDAVNEYLDEAVDELANTFLPELANDYMKVYKLALDQPVVLTGGMACIPGIVDEFEARLSEELDREIEATAAEQPADAATVGAQRIAERLVENS